MGGRGGAKNSGSKIAFQGHETLREMLVQHEITPREYKDAVQGHMEMKKAYTDWTKGLKQDQIYALGEYQGSGYHEINAFLRKAENGQTVTTDNGTKDTIRQMTDALNLARVPHDMVVYRGISGPEGVLNEAEVKTMVATKKYFDGGFMSTSISSGFARGWAANADSMAANYDSNMGKLESKGYHGYALRIELPKGAKAAYLTAATGSMEGEYELTIQRGSRYAITGYSLEDRYPGSPSMGKVWVINARWLGTRKSNVNLKYDY